MPQKYERVTKKACKEEFIKKQIVLDMASTYRQLVSFNRQKSFCIICTHKKLTHIYRVSTICTHQKLTDISTG
jgi:hypothetical protein